MVRFPLHVRPRLHYIGLASLYSQTRCCQSVYLLLDDRNVMITMDMINIHRKRRHIDLRFSPLYLSVHVQFDLPIHM